MFDLCISSLQQNVSTVMSTSWSAVVLIKSAVKDTGIDIHPCSNIDLRLRNRLAYPLKSQHSGGAVLANPRSEPPLVVCRSSYEPALRGSPLSFSLYGARGCTSSADYYPTLNGTEKDCLKETLLSGGAGQVSERLEWSS